MGRKRLAYLIPALAMTATAPVAKAAESVFSKLNLDRCPVVVEDQGGVVLRCPGLKGYSVLYKEGDLRPSVFYGSLDKRTEESAFESFSAFASVNDTVEWRMDKGKPFAAILRFFIANTDPEKGDTPERLKGQVLVVARVGSPEDPASCVVGLVDALANKKANELARDVADEKARDFACGVDEALYEGEKGDLSSDFTSNLKSIGNPE